MNIYVWFSCELLGWVLEWSWRCSTDSGASGVNAQSAHASSGFPFLRKTCYTWGTEECKWKAGGMRDRYIHTHLYWVIFDKISAQGAQIHLYYKWACLFLIWDFKFGVCVNAASQYLQWRRCCKWTVWICLFRLPTEENVLQHRGQLVEDGSYICLRNQINSEGERIIF